MLFVLVLQCLVVLLCVAVTTAVAISVTERALRDATAERVLAVAQHLAEIDLVRESAGLPRQAATEALQPLAETIRAASGVDYVVIMDAEGTRLTHPSRGEIGEAVSTDPSGVLDGETYLGTQEGTLGPTLRAKVPVVADGAVVGGVSVGILESRIAADFADALWGLLPWVAGSVIVGCLLSAALTSIVRRRVRRLEAQSAELETQRRVAAALRDQTHEFHTRLHVIRGLVAENDAAAALDYIGSFVEVADAPAATLVRDPAARAILAATATRMEGRGAALEVDERSSVDPGTLDDDALTVLSNLCRNAAEACRAHVRVFVATDAAGAHLAVGDDGPGIPAADVARIFDRGVSSKGPQRGIGLDLVRRTVGERGGTVEVGVSPAGGALFTVDLPARRAGRRAGVDRAGAQA